MPNYPHNGTLDYQDIVQRGLRECTTTQFRNMWSGEQSRWLNASDVLWIVDREPTMTNDDDGKSDQHDIRFCKQRIQHTPLPDPLFPEKPGIHHIQQASIGNCWFLAAVASILHYQDGPGILESMMCQDPNSADWVYLRLFEPPQASRPQVNERFVKLRKTSVVHVPGPAPARGQPPEQRVFHSQSNKGWILMLEKAMTLFKRGSEYDYQHRTRCYRAFSPGHPRYINLVGGHSHHAFTMLLGEKGESDSIRGSTEIDKASGEYANLTALLQLPDSSVVNRNNWLNVYNDNNHAYLKAIFSNPNHFQIFVNETDGKGEELIREFEKLYHTKYIPGKEQYLRESLREDDFTAFITYNAGLKNQDVKDAIISWAKRSHIFPGKRGSGDYSTGQLDLFNKIQTLLRDRPVCLGTTKLVGKSPQGVGHSGGEAMAKGLVGGHAYAVLDTHQQGNERYLLVFNPWDRYIKVYSQKKVEVAQKIATSERVNVFQSNQYTRIANDTGGLFWLDLSDVTKRCNSYYTTENPPGISFPRRISVTLRAPNLDLAPTHKANILGIAPQHIQQAPDADIWLQLPFTFMHDENLDKLKEASLKMRIGKPGGFMLAEGIIPNYGCKLPDDRFITPAPAPDRPLTVVGNVNPEAPPNDWNRYSTRVSDYMMKARVTAKQRGSLSLRKWEELTSVAFGKRNRILRVDAAITDYGTVFEKLFSEDPGKKVNYEFRVRLLHQVDALSKIFMETAFYLQNYRDSGRRSWVKKLEFLVVYELTRLSHIYNQVKGSFQGQTLKEFAEFFDQGISGKNQVKHQLEQFKQQQQQQIQQQIQELEDLQSQPDQNFTLIKENLAGDQQAIRKVQMMGTPAFEALKLRVYTSQEHKISLMGQIEQQLSIAEQYIAQLMLQHNQIAQQLQQAPQPPQPAVQQQPPAANQIRSANLVRMDNQIPNHIAILRNRESEMSKQSDRLIGIVDNKDHIQPYSSAWEAYMYKKVPTLFD